MSEIWINGYADDKIVEKLLPFIPLYYPLDLLLGFCWFPSLT
jgi:hypothetical protein